MIPDYGSGIGNGHWLPSCILTGVVHARMTEDAPAEIRDAAEVPVKEDLPLDFFISDNSNVQEEMV
ncbi:7888_t:CDS:2 [Ambispora leptoticha]|uniref:7888_t:CDS:1 n=1 Tax=Ambispora leptoticha TaxID=144679 RepID=A0A9N9F6C6_9GLOM|nr:7888_t:CDS:2 [Ambispora leptoticha]